MEGFFLSNKEEYYICLLQTRPDLTRLQFEEDIQNIINHPSFNDESNIEYFLEDIKNEFYTTFLPVINIINKYLDKKDYLLQLLIDNINIILSNNDKLVQLLKCIFIQLKLQCPYIYTINMNLTECILYFLNIRVVSENSNNISNFNNGNLIIYNILLIFCSLSYNKQNNIHSILVDLKNKKIKDIITIAEENNFKRQNIHLFTCQHCQKIFNTKLPNCPCGAIFCGKICQKNAWRAWHREICPERIIN